MGAGTNTMGLPEASSGVFFENIKNFNHEGHEEHKGLRPMYTVDSGTCVAF